MRTCYVLGGLGESTLSRDPDGGRVVFVDLGVIMRGVIAEMTLAPDGISPGPPDGVQLFASGVLGPYLGFPASVLAVQLALRGWAVQLWPWDWRKPVYLAGVDLAAWIRGHVAEDEPCAILAHSAGGLVARAVWTELGKTDQQHLVSRIVTLGTPHWGSYSVVDYFSGANEAQQAMIRVNNTLGYNTYGWAPNITGFRLLTPLDFQKLGITWPGFYDCLPVLGAPGSEDDVHRVKLFTATNWAEAARPQQAWLDWSRDITGTWLRSPESQPPSHILTCVSGFGTSTPGQLRDPEQLGRPGAVGGFTDGDSAVIQSSAELAGGVVVRYAVDHLNMMATLANSGDLADLVTAERSPAPPPPPVVDDQPQTTYLAAIPFASPPLSGAPSLTCSSGKCAC
jgi:PGAP1-like protein